MSALQNTSASAFASAWPIAADIEGWLAESQAEALFNAAAQVAPGHAIVEIGSHHGKSTVVMARAKAAGVTLLAVDPFDDPAWGGGPDARHRFEANLDKAGVTDQVKHFAGLSLDAAAAYDGEPIGFVYIDGAHDLASVLADIDAWLPKVVDGGRVYLHDAYSLVGTTFGVIRRMAFNPSVKYLGSVRSLAMFQKVHQAPAAVAWDTSRLIGRLGYFGRNLVIRQGLRRGWKRVPELLGHDGAPVTF